MTRQWVQHLQSGETWEDTFPLKSKTGEWRGFLSRTKPTYDENNQIVHWFGTNTDITEQRKSKEELTRKIDLVAWASEALGRIQTQLELIGCKDLVSIFHNKSSRLTEEISL